MQTAKVGADVIAFERPQEGWGLGRRVAFRFVFMYCVLYVFPFPLQRIPGLEWITEGLDALQYRLAAPLGEALFGLTVLNEPTGSGDTAFAFVMLLVYAALAALVTLAWSVVDRRRPHYRWLFAALLVYVRFWLAATMMSYGTVKVWKSQFPMPQATRLIEPVGEMSPMALLWTFMGHSTAYTVFAGLGEMVGGALLFVRRTALLGALIVAGVMSNVVMLNLAYDVPVKQFSMHLLGFALLVAAPHLSRLWRFFVVGSAVPAEAPPGSARLRAGGALAGLVIAALLTGIEVKEAITSYHTWGDGAPRSPIAGVYEVEEQIVDGVVVPPLLTEVDRLRRVAFSPSLMSTITVGDAFARFRMTADAEYRKLSLVEVGGAQTPHELTLTPEADGRFVLAGKFRGHELRATLRKRDEGSFRLHSRPFRWIQEQPYNR